MTKGGSYLSPVGRSDVRCRRQKEGQFLDSLMSSTVPQIYRTDVLLAWTTAHFHCSRKAPPTSHTFWPHAFPYRRHPLFSNIAFRANEHPISHRLVLHDSSLIVYGASSTPRCPTSVIGVIISIRRAVSGPVFVFDYRIGPLRRSTVPIDDAASMLRPITALRPHGLTAVQVHDDIIGIPTERRGLREPSGFLASS